MPLCVLSLCSVLSGSEDEAGVAALEEKESLAIQRRLAAQLNEDDFGITEFVQVEQNREM